VGKTLYERRGLEKFGNDEAQGKSGMGVRTSSTRGWGNQVGAGRRVAGAKRPLGEGLGEVLSLEVGGEKPKNPNGEEM